MSPVPVGQLMGIGTKLGMSACCSVVAQHIDRPVIGILVGAAMLVPLAWCLEDVLQWPRQSSQNSSCKVTAASTGNSQPAGFGHSASAS